MAVALVVILIWSACFVAIRATQGDVPPRLSSALRALLGGLPLLAVAAAQGRLLPPPTAWGWIALLGLTNTTLGLAGMFLAVGLAGAALPAVLANSQALLVAPLAVILFGETLTAVRLGGLVLGLAGVALVMPFDASGSGTLWGAAVALLAAAGLAVANLVIKHLGASVHAVTATAWQYLLGALPLLAWALSVEDVRAAAWSPRAVAGLVFLGVVGSAVASWVWYRLVRDGELIALNALTLLTPALAVLLAVVIYWEPLRPVAWGGVAAVLAGVTVAGWPAHNGQHRQGNRRRDSSRAAR